MRFYPPVARFSRLSARYDLRNLAAIGFSIRKTPRMAFDLTVNLSILSPQKGYRFNFGGWVTGVIRNVLKIHGIRRICTCGDKFFRRGTCRDNRQYSGDGAVRLQHIDRLSRWD